MFIGGGPTGETGGWTLLGRVYRPTTAYYDYNVVVDKKYDYKVVTLGGGWTPVDSGWADRCPLSGPAAPSNIKIAGSLISSGSCGEQYTNPFNILWRDNATNEKGFRVVVDGQVAGYEDCWRTSPPIDCSVTSGIPNPSSSNYEWPSFDGYSLAGVCGDSGCHNLNVRAYCDNQAGIRRWSNSVAKSVCSASGGNVSTSVTWSAGGEDPATINWSYTPPTGVYGTLFSVYRCNFSAPNSVCDTCSTVLTSGLSGSSYVDDDNGSSSNRCYLVRAYTSSCPYPCATPTPCAPVCPGPAPVLAVPADGYLLN